MTYLGDAVEHLDQVLDCRDGRPGGSEVIGIHKWILPANWKFAAENFLGDTYHNPSHRSVDMIGIGPSARAGQTGRRDNEYNNGQHVWVQLPRRPRRAQRLDAAPTLITSRRTANTPSSTNTSANASTIASTARPTRRGSCPSPAICSPTPPITAASRAVSCVWHPHSPTETEAWRFLLADADAPARSQGRAAPVLHALLRSRRNDRAGRHGKLAVRNHAPAQERSPADTRSITSSRWVRIKATIRRPATSACRSPNRTPATTTMSMPAT